MVPFSEKSNSENHTDNDDNNDTRWNTHSNNSILFIRIVTNIKTVFSVTTICVFIITTITVFIVTTITVFIKAAIGTTIYIARNGGYQ